MLSFVDYENGRLNIVMLRPKEKNKVTNICIDLNAVHTLDKMDLHRKKGEMLNRYVTIANLGIKKMQVINKKIIN
jgi:hypothetical protein